MTGHDVKAFLEHTNPQLPPELRPYWHDDMTSYDTQDTATCLTLVESVQILKAQLSDLLETVYGKALAHKYTPMIGRTHGIHAEPITLGVKLANWYAELARHHLSLEEMAITIRTLQRTEIREMQEFFRKGQTGSSAMPHKRNPIGPENLSGMGRVMRGYALMADESIQTWDERSIDNSGPERIYLPDASILLHYMLRRMTGVLKRIIIFPDRMMQNIWMTKNLVFSQEITSLVVKKSGLPREAAYKLVYDIAQSCWESNLNFFCALLNNKELMGCVDVADLLPCFDLNSKLKHVDHIFKMVFGE